LQLANDLNFTLEPGRTEPESATIEKFGVQEFLVYNSGEGVVIRFDVKNR
jgi:hypothetical protein